MGFLPFTRAIYFPKGRLLRFSSAFMWLLVVLPRDRHQVWAERATGASGGNGCGILSLYPPSQHGGSAQTPVERLLASWKGFFGTSMSVGGRVLLLASLPRLFPSPFSQPSSSPFSLRLFQPLFLSPFPSPCFVVFCPFPCVYSFMGFK